MSSISNPLEATSVAINILIYPEVISAIACSRSDYQTDNEWNVRCKLEK